MKAKLGDLPVDTVVCDIDGVLLLGAEPIAGAAEALVELREAGLSLIFASNNSTRSPARIAERLEEVVGFTPDEASVVNSGLATARFIADKVRQVFVMGSPGLRATLTEAGIGVTSTWQEADAVVTGLNFDVRYDDLAEACLAIQSGAAFYATNLDASYPRPDGLYPGAGALTAVIETTTGRSPVVCGKPYPPMRAALEDLGGDHPLIVGDRPDTDLALGKAEGWATALVLTGVIAAASQVPADLTPDVVLASIADLPGALGLA